jgi:hypothetical protein
MHSYFGSHIEVVGVAHYAVAFRHDNEFLAGNVVYLHSLAHKLFRLPVGVDVRSVPLLV